MAVEWRLQAVLDERGKTGYWLAKEAELQVPTIYRLLNADAVKHIDARTLFKICTALECQPGDLLVAVPEKGEKKKQR